MKRPSQLLVLTLLAALLVGCETLSYYRQAVGGHLSLMMSGEAVAELLEDPDTDPELRQQLLIANQARRFARERLDLPVGDSYTEYVELDRPWVLVNLISAPEFSLDGPPVVLPLRGMPDVPGLFRYPHGTFEGPGKSGPKATTPLSAASPPTPPWVGLTTRSTAVSPPSKRVEWWP
jgi:Predicted aminopeptidase